MIYDTVIVGNGPAGLTAAIYAQRAGLNTLVIAESPVDGGQIATTYEVDNYPGMKGIGGMELGMKFREHADQLETRFLEDRLVEIRDEGDHKTLILDQGEAVETKTVVLALGANHRWVPVFPIVQPATEHFTVRRSQQLWAAAMWHWRMHSFYHALLRRFTLYIEEMRSAERRCW